MFLALHLIPYVLCSPPYKCFSSLLRSKLTYRRRTSTPLSTVQHLYDYKYCTFHKLGQYLFYDNNHRAPLASTVLYCLRRSPAWFGFFSVLSSVCLEGVWTARVFVLVTSTFVRCLPCSGEIFFAIHSQVKNRSWDVILTFYQDGRFF